MQIQNTRFGTTEIDDDAVITFPDGLVVALTQVRPTSTAAPVAATGV